METKEETQEQEATAPQTPEAAAPDAGEQPAQQSGRSTRKERVGTVVSDKMQKSIVVSIERQQQHPMYAKYLKRTGRLMAHDENDEAREGDTVRIMETRAFSKNKRWRLVEIIERAE